MAATIVQGIVTSVHLERASQFGRSAYGSYEEPIKIEITLNTADGRVFVSTQVGRHVVGLDRPVDCEYVSESQKRAAWPMAIEAKEGIVRSASLEVFPRAFCLASRLVSTIWEGDQIAVRGSLNGRRITRATIVELERDGQPWRAA